MPTLKILLPGSPPKSVRVYKRLTSIGRAQANDVVVDDAGIGETHAHLHFDGREFSVTCLEKNADLVINGKRRRKHALIHDDRIKLGRAELVFSVFEEAPQGESEQPQPVSELGAYRKVYDFSARLLDKYDLDELLGAMMDAIVDVAGADKGFLVLTEGDGLTVKVARNIRKENIEGAVAQLSDSIIAKVVRTRQPLIVSDALHDAEFANAQSVMSLRLTSVMCVPLLERGSLLGVIYVGADGIGRLFGQGSLDVLTVFAAQASIILRNALLVSELKLDNQRLQTELERTRFGDIIGTCTAMQEVYKRIQKVAATDISVLITGETGTGKELVAREIHRRSPRAKGAFISINCGAISEGLLESEMFGHVKGAFTGAHTNKPGQFHAANGGTLFLDEIGEMPVHLQVKLLRVLQERVVVRVGDTRPDPVDIRVVAATNRELEQEIKNGRFREDLYFRLNVVQLHLPPLRERGDDLLVIGKYLLGRYAAEYKTQVKGMSPQAAMAIKRYPWPGNIRELENRIKKAVVLAEQTLLLPGDLDLEQVETPQILPLADARERWQREYINEVLALNAGNRTKTARDLGVDPRTIFRHLEQLEQEGLVVPSVRRDDAEER